MISCRQRINFLGLSEQSTTNGWLKTMEILYFWRLEVQNQDVSNATPLGTL